ncbi:hypothetical protein QWY97_10535 [Vibrio cortegadensis]|uniref:hypothetical protein n=1 Tax=Vibrio cortegadensis TaxID=1328770 RepID=UPI0021C2D31B|nr:hypothetical protein [Vibrio cortegadensis]MDN3697782.1 hypothetical protein [Vibrio cortegadensis]
MNEIFKNLPHGSSRNKIEYLAEELGKLAGGAVTNLIDNGHFHGMCARGFVTTQSRSDRPFSLNVTSLGGRAEFMLAHGWAIQVQPGAGITAPVSRVGNYYLNTLPNRHFAQIMCQGFTMYQVLRPVAPQNDESKSVRAAFNVMALAGAEVEVGFRFIHMSEDGSHTLGDKVASKIHTDFAGDGFVTCDSGALKNNVQVEQPSYVALYLEVRNSGIVGLQRGVCGFVADDADLAKLEFTHAPPYYQATDCMKPIGFEDLGAGLIRFNHNAIHAPFGMARHMLASGYHVQTITEHGSDYKVFQYPVDHIPSAAQLEAMQMSFQYSSMPTGFDFYKV